MVDPCSGPPMFACFAMAEGDREEREGRKGGDAKGHRKAIFVHCYPTFAFLAPPFCVL